MSRGGRRARTFKRLGFDKNRAKSRKNKKGVSGCRAVTLIYTRAYCHHTHMIFGRLKPICGIVFASVRETSTHSPGP